MHSDFETPTDFGWLMLMHSVKVIEMHLLMDSVKLKGFEKHSQKQTETGMRSRKHSDFVMQKDFGCLMHLRLDSDLQRQKRWVTVKLMATMIYLQKPTDFGLHLR